jgi:anti-sigma factor RsiW
MTHAQAIERIDDFASGELPDIERRLMERHLDGCGECRAEAEALRALLAEVAVLPRAIAPPADLWQAIVGRLEPRPAADAPWLETRVISLAPRRRLREPPRWALQAAAAVVLVVGSSLATATLMHRRAPTGPVATLPATGATAPVRASTPAEGTLAATPARTGAAPTVQRGASRPVTALAAFRPAEREYQRAVDDLARVLETRRESLAPETAATLERNLAIIDAAIAESREALERDPNSRELTRMLSSTYDAKVQLLRQAVQL